MAIGSPQILEYKPDVILRICRPTALDIAGFGESPVVGYQLGNGDVCPIGLGDDGLPAIGQPLRNQTIVLGLAGPCAVGTEVVTGPSDRDDRLPGASDTWKLPGLASALCSPPELPKMQNDTCRFGSGFSGRTADHRQVSKSKIRQGLEQVEARRLELPTLALRTPRSPN